MRVFFLIVAFVRRRRRLLNTHRSRTTRSLTAVRVQDTTNGVIMSATQGTSANGINRSLQITILCPSDGKSDPYVRSFSRRWFCAEISLIFIFVFCLFFFVMFFFVFVIANV
jgi:hypothetical protein